MNYRPFSVAEKSSFFAANFFVKKKKRVFIEILQRDIFLGFGIFLSPVFMPFHRKPTTYSGHDCRIWFLQGQKNIGASGE